ncbi:hypothetical protein QE152_g40790, partial [Popillia japonica]
KIELVWRNQETTLKAEYLKGNVKHGGETVFVWGCMTASGAGKLVFIDQVTTKSPDVNLIEHLWQKLKLRDKKQNC